MINGDTCHVILQELNHKVYALNCNIQLSSISLNPNCFQEIIDYIISNMYNIDIKKIYFDKIRFIYKFIGFNLFGQCRASFKNKLQEHVSFDDLKSGKKSYNWIESGFLPKLGPDVEQLLIHIEKKPHNVFKVFHKGKYNDVSYTLDSNYTVDYNYFYDIHPTDLIPVFNVYINTKMIHLSPNNIPEKLITDTRLHIRNKFNLFNITLTIG